MHISDIVAQARREIHIFERPSADTSNELMSAALRLQDLLIRARGGLDDYWVTTEEGVAFVCELDECTK